MRNCRMKGDPTMSLSLEEPSYSGSIKTKSISPAADAALNDEISQCKLRARAVRWTRNPILVSSVCGTFSD